MKTNLSSKIHSMHDVFSSDGRFHFFSGKPQTRKRAIGNITTALVNAESEKTATTSDVSKKRKVMPGTEINHHLIQLEEMFCS